MTSTADRLVEDYLRGLDRELSASRARRRELWSEIASHIAEARAGLDSEDEAEIRNLLEPLGDPRRSQPRRGACRPRSRRAGLVEILALIRLLVGGFVFVIGWFVGLVASWGPDAWTTGRSSWGRSSCPAAASGAFIFLLGGRRLRRAAADDRRPGRQKSS